MNALWNRSIGLECIGVSVWYSIGVPLYAALKDYECIRGIDQ